MTDTTEFVTPAQYSLPSSPADQELTPLDLVVPRMYGTRWILAFPLSPEADKSQTHENLRQGLAHTIHAIPWIAGSIGLKEGSDPAQERVRILDSASGGVMLRYKDLREDLPSYDDLKEKNFPLDKLPNDKVSPVGVMAEPPAPVMAAQANFIKGGLLLTVALHHSAGDATALETILSAWAQNTAATAAASGSNNSSSGSVFTSCDAPSNDRSILMQGTPPESMAEFPEYVLRPNEKQLSLVVDETAATAAAAFQLPPMSGRIFYFSAAKLADLKREAAAYSTNDALCAFLWCQMTTARNPAASSSSSSATEGKVSAFTSAVNIRGRTNPPLPSSYLGNASLPSMTDRLPVSELITGPSESNTAAAPTGPLKRAAAAIRASLQRYQSPTRVPQTIGLLGSRADPSDYKHTFRAFLGPDVVASSWSDIRLLADGNNWGGEMGAPEVFRIPGDDADGAVVIMPRRPGEDGLEVVVGLELGAMRRLLESKEFRRVAEVRC
ncbi:uncharacterized protein PG986_011377 [Apiospora aurea]|uniref:Trichothecene 3-O-acetyltransferase-like N-terminal domain-containing protein n=1 Tax=Apiospora aurea TaxID=335848 RepID=A0ABR1Q4W8_9PEZI